MHTTNIYDTKFRSDVKTNMNIQVNERTRINLITYVSGDYATKLTE